MLVTLEIESKVTLCLVSSDCLWLVILKPD